MKNGKKYFLLILTIAAAIVTVVSVVVFTLKNRENIANNNRQYLIDNTSQMAILVNNSLLQGLTNIQALSNLVGEWFAVSENGEASLQRSLKNSIFDFFEFTDTEGKNHNITGGVSEAGDRQYYLDAMQGNSGMELLFHSRATNETLLVFYSPIYNNQGEIIGSLSGVYKERKQLSSLLAMDVFGYRAEAFLCREDGVIIASNQDVDTRAEISITEVLGPRLAEGVSVDSLIYRGKTAVVPLAGNETGACIMGLADSDWYIIQVFPEQATEMMVSRANRIGINSAVFLTVALLILLLLTYLILTGSMLETQKALEKAEAASRAKTDFLFSMSHDIRTPMNAITGFLRLLKKEQTRPAGESAYLRRIEDASQILLSIINNVLEMSQIEGGTIVLEEAAWIAERMVEASCAPLLPAMASRRMTFEKSVEVTHPFVWCDKAKIQEIYWNILNNACQYTPEGGSISLRLTEIPSDREGYACFQTEIEDNGIGMSSDFLPQVFEPFSRERDTTHSKIAGTGLGLSIAKRLAELMGGRIEAESEHGTGTRITVILPLRIASEADVCDEQAEEQTPSGLSGKRILLVEDNDFNAEFAADLLGEMGAEVERAQDGAMGVAMMERAAAGYYDLILMDTQMPNMNGYQAAQAIRNMEDPLKASTPIVAMTANTFEEDKKNAYAAGMNAHLAKPVDIPELMKTLKELL